MQDREFDGLIKSSLAARVDGAARPVMPPDDMFERIKRQIHREMDTGKMKVDMASGRASFFRFGFARPVLAGLCCLLLVAGTAFAADSISRYVNGWLTTKEYGLPPSRGQITNDAGFPAKIPGALPGGFKLDHASLATHMAGSEQGIVVNENRKVIGATYGKEALGSDASLVLSASNDATETPAPDHALTVDVGGTTAHYWEYTLHVVPAGYEPTEQEMEDELAGRTVIVYVSGEGDAVAIPERSETVRSLKWEDSGVWYVLSDRGCGLTMTELTGMAQSIIELE